jgi:hypothetical protein
MIIGLDKSQSVVTVQKALTQFGNTIDDITFLGVPVRCVDQLVNSEDPVE